MNKQVTMGGYLPGDSFLHRLDPRIKINLVLIFIIVIFQLNRIISYLPYIAFLMIIVLVAQLPLSRLFASLKPLWILLLLTFFVNLLTTEGHILWHWHALTITEEGLYKACFISIRVILLILATRLLTLTTSLKKLTKGMEKLLSPLKVFKFPAAEVALMISIALAFIPVLYRESDKIRRAQMARGADFESGSIVERAQASLPLIVPLFVNAMERARELSIAMEARCYRGGEGRTELHPLQIKKSDWLALFLCGTAFICGAVFL